MSGTRLKLIGTGLCILGVIAPLLVEGTSFSWGLIVIGIFTFSAGRFLPSQVEVVSKKKRHGTDAKST